MADNTVDLDQLANDVAKQHAISPDGLQSRADRALKNVPIYPLQPPTKKDSATTRFMHGVGLPASLSEVKSTFSNPSNYNPYNMFTQGPKMAKDLISTISGEAGEQLEQMQHYDPITGQDPNLGKFMAHSAGAEFPYFGPPLAEGDIATAAGRATPFAAPIVGKALRTIVPEQFKSDLINKAVGKGSIDPSFQKDYGLSLRRTKPGALTRGQIANPSAGIETESGLPKATSAGLDQAATLKNQLLQHPAAQVKNIPVKDIIEDNFGPISRHPITGAPDVTAKTATNIPDATTQQFSEFGNKLLQELVTRGGPTLQLSPADIEVMRSEKVIDPNYGQYSTDAPAASLNQKAGKVSSDLVKRAENALRLPSGESALELLNSHMAGLMQGKKVLPFKIEEMRTGSPTVLPSFNPRTIGQAVTKAAVSEGINTMAGKTGFRSGRITMPLRTGLSSLLTEKPWWLEDPTRGLQTPQATPSGAPNAPPPSSPTNLGDLTPNARHSVSGLLGPAPKALESSPKPSTIDDQGLSGSQPPPATSGPPTASDAMEAGKPTHINVGDKVTGFDPDGNMVAGELQSMHPVIGKDGIKQWRAFILDLKKSKVVDLPADEVKGIKSFGSYKKPTKPPGAEPAGVAGGPPIGPDEPFSNPGKDVHDKAMNTLELAKARMRPDKSFQKEPFLPKDYEDPAIKVLRDVVNRTMGKHPTSENVTSISPHLADKKMNEWLGRLEKDVGVGNFRNNPNATSPEVIEAAKKLKFTLRAADNLGFDTVGEAFNAIRNYDDWTDRWDVKGLPDLIKAGEQWKKAIGARGVVVPFKPKNPK